MAYETGHGNGEWNFNVGNRKALPGEKGFWLKTSEPADASWFRAYDDLDAGVHDYLTMLMSNRYQSAWLLLQSAPLSSAWVRQLVSSGYAGNASPDIYERGYRAVLAKVPS